MFLILVKLYISFVFFMVHAFCVLRKLALMNSQRFVFFQKFYSFSAYIQASEPVQVNFCIYEVRVIFPYGCPNIRAPFVETVSSGQETSLFPFSYIGIFVKNQLNMYVWVYFWALLLCPINLYVYPYTIQTVNYCWLIVSIEIRKCN